MELWDARHEDGSLAGFDLVRGELIPEGYYHLVVEVLVRHVDGDHLLMQRDLTKLGYPGYFEPGASGSALKGETPDEAAKRELFEETGIVATNLKELYHTRDGQTLYVMYQCLTDWPKDGITLQAGETMNYRWLNQSEFLSWLQSDEVIAIQRKRLATYAQSLMKK